MSRAPQMPPATPPDDRGGPYRRRRRIAAAVGAGVLILVAAAIAAGNSGPRWDPESLSSAVVAAGPRVALDRQAALARREISQRRAARRRETVGLAAIAARSPYVRRGGPQGRRVALTFDDGPGPYTQRVLDVLQRERVDATFFVLGRQLAGFPAPLQRAIAQGHVIADHTWNHRDLARLRPRDQAAEIDSLASAVQAAGIPRPTLFRPPYGTYDRETLRILRRRHLLMVLWTVDTSDYSASATPPQVAARVLSEVEPGGIVLMHDAGGDRAVTARALTLVIRGLRRRGYTLVTVPQLLLRTKVPRRQEYVAPSSGA